MDAKFYHATSANRKFSGITFEVYAVIGGCPMGRYTTSDPAEIEALDKLVEDERSGVTATTQAEYEASSKKNISHSVPIQAMRQALTHPRSAEPVAAGSNQPQPDAVDVTAEVEAVSSDLKPASEAIQTGDVEPAPKPTPVKRARTRKKVAA